MQPGPRTHMEVANAGTGSFRAEAPYWKKALQASSFSLSAIWLEKRQIMPGHRLLLPILDLGSSYPHFGPVLDRHPFKQGVCHTVALPLTLKNILRQKIQNYENSNVSPWKNIIRKKSFKINPNILQDIINSITNLKFQQHKWKYHLWKILVWK